MSDNDEGLGIRPSSAEASDQEVPSQDSLASPDGPTVQPRKGYAHLVFIGIFLSRIAGIIRARVMARYFAQGLESDAFNNALKIPNFMQNLLGEGTLSASFIPVYSTLIKEGREEEAGKVAGTVFAVLCVLAGLFSLIGIFAAPAIVLLVGKNLTGDKRELTIACLRILMPMTSILVLSAWALGIQNSHRRFLMSYVAPVMWSGAMIATLFMFGPRYHKDLHQLTIALSWGALLGGALQFFVQVPSVLKLEKQLKIGWDLQMEPIREIARNAGPAIAGRGVVQFSSYVDLYLANSLAVSNVTAMSNALLLYMLPISLFGMSVAASELPDLAREGAGSMEQLRQRVNDGLRQIYFFVVPSFVAFVMLGDIVVATIFQNGRFSRFDTLQVYVVLVSFSLGLVASTGTRLFSSTFFALKDTRFPARTAMVRVFVSGVLGYAVMYQFDKISVGDHKTLGAAGLGFAASVAAWIEWATLRNKLSKAMGPVGAGASTLARMFAVAILASAVGRGIAYVTPHMNHVIRGAVVLGPVGVLYLGMTYAMGMPQSRALVNRVIRR